MFKDLLETVGLCTLTIAAAAPPIASWPFGHNTTALLPHRVSIRRIGTCSRVLGERMETFVLFNACVRY
jgi:hypothetical protein